MERNVLQPIVFNLAQQNQLQKPVLVITITDGEPSDSPRDAILQVIKNARARLSQYGPKPLAFQFAQVCNWESMLILSFLCFLVCSVCSVASLSGQSDALDDETNNSTGMSLVITSSLMSLVIQ
jgi:hypothetical protein